jgi:16S rRNA (cytosine1402-N4)-methyltransferase
MEIVHTSVLLQECLTNLAPERPGSLMVDGTLGEGGHSEAFLTNYPDLRIIGIDADVTIQARARERLAPFGDRVCFYPGWSDVFFKEYPEGEKKPDIILIDLAFPFHYENRCGLVQDDEPPI